MEKIITSYDQDQTIKAGEELAGKLAPQDIVFLQGNLGSGKTTFAKGIAKGLGITSRVISPTFVVVRAHHIENQPGKKLLIKTMYHLDLYRLHDEKEALNIDLKDFLDDKSAVVIIEWPDIGQNIIQKKVWKVQLEHEDSDTRKITIKHE